NQDFIAPGTERARRTLGELLAANPLLAARAQELTGAADGGEALQAMARRFVEAQEALFRVYDVVPHDRSPEGTRRLAAALRAAVPHLAGIDPDRIEEQMERAVGLFLVVGLIVTAISTVVGGLLIVNTMAMAVLERRREIGIKTAV